MAEPELHTLYQSTFQMDLSINVRNEIVSILRESMGNVFLMSEIVRPFQYDKLKSYKRWVHSHKPKKILHGKNHHKQNQKT